MIKCPECGEHTQREQICGSCGCEFELDIEDDEVPA